MIGMIVTGLLCFIIGGALAYIVFRYVAKSKYNAILTEAETEAEVIKQKKLLEVKEKFLNKMSELEKEVAIRNKKIQQAEHKLKQREIAINRRHEEAKRKNTEVDAIKENLEKQLSIIEEKQEELVAIQIQQREKLEEISGLSAIEARDHLVESLKEEAKTQADRKSVV